MKLFITLFFTLMISATFAMDISPKILLDFESSIALQKDILKLKIKKSKHSDGTHLGQTSNTISLIESKIKKAELKISTINSDENLNEENIIEIETLLSESQNLLQNF